MVSTLSSGVPPSFKAYRPPIKGATRSPIP